jgi:L-alanine-DL-glutamate epimerase-like enolase superfamily enzyme
MGRPCTPHISGAGLGMLYVLHFASIVPNAGPHQEYKGPNRDIPYEVSPGDLDAVEGVIPVPTGPGLGVTLDPDWVAKSEVLASLP